MGWEAVKLGNIADFSNGINFDKSAYTSGVKLIGVSNFKNRFCPDYNELSEVKKDIVRAADYLANGDIVFVRSNGNKELVGRCMLIESPPNPITFSGFCIRLRLLEPQKYDPRFFTYHFKSMDFRRAMSGTAVGTNIQNLSQQRLANYTAFIPDIDTQRRIADILSAYDNLIENNRKQIKLLEEAAQRLYKEWFVDLRFPGWETTEIVDGVPVGWKKVPVGDTIEYEIGGGWGNEEADEYFDAPAYVIRGTDLYGINHGDYSNLPFRYHKQGNLNARKLQDRDIIFEVSGGSKTEGVAKTLLLRNQFLKQMDYPVMCASFCKLVRTKKQYSAQYMFDTFQYMRRAGITQEYDKKSASSIVNYRWKDFLSQQMVLIPECEVLEKYASVSRSVYDLIVRKSIAIEKAKQARDRLLPKLMSGELEV